MRALVIIATIALLALSGCLSTPDDTTPPPDDGMDGTEGGSDGGAGNTTAGPVQESSASWLIGVSGCGIVFPAALDGVDHAWIAVASDAKGLPFTATYSAALPTVEFGVSFFQGEAFLESFTGGEEVTGTVPADADTGIFWSCLGAEVNVEFVVGA